MSSMDTSQRLTGWRPSSVRARNQPGRGLRKSLFTAMLLLALTTFVMAQGPPSANDAMAPAKADAVKPGQQDQDKMLSEVPSNTTAPPPADSEAAEELASNKSRVAITSVFPAAGPTSGGTKVVVRGNFKAFKDQTPLCKFGEVPAAGVFVQCRNDHVPYWLKEGFKQWRTDTCVQCEESPDIKANELTKVPFTVTFSTELTSNALDFTYYLPHNITAVKPRFGPKDGETQIEIWGKGFVDFSD